MSPSDYPHLMTITTCPICGRYKERRKATCGYHPDVLNARCIQIIDDYERALADRAKREATKPMKPAKPQEPCDVGLFGDERLQLDLVEMLQDPDPQ